MNFTLPFYTVLLPITYQIFDVGQFNISVIFPSYNELTQLGGLLKLLTSFPLWEFNVSAIA